MILFHSKTKIGRCLFEESIRMVQEIANASLDKDKLSPKFGRWNRDVRIVRQECPTKGKGAGELNLPFGIADINKVDHVLGRKS